MNHFDRQAINIRKGGAIYQLPEGSVELLRELYRGMYDAPVGSFSSVGMYEIKQNKNNPDSQLIFRADSWASYSDIPDTPTLNKRLRSVRRRLKELGWQIWLGNTEPESGLAKFVLEAKLVPLPEKVAPPKLSDWDETINIRRGGDMNFFATVAKHSKDSLFEIRVSTFGPPDEWFPVAGTHGASPVVDRAYAHTRASAKKKAEQLLRDHEGVIVSTGWCSHQTHTIPGRKPIELETVGEKGTDLALFVTPAQAKLVGDGDYVRFGKKDHRVLGNYNLGWTAMLHLQNQQSRVWHWNDKYVLFDVLWKPPNTRRYIGVYDEGDEDEEFRRKHLMMDPEFVDFIGLDTPRPSLVRILSKHKTAKECIKAARNIAIRCKETLMNTLPPGSSHTSRAAETHL